MIKLRTDHGYLLYLALKALPIKPLINVQSLRACNSIVDKLYIPLKDFIDLYDEFTDKRKKAISSFQGGDPTVMIDFNSDEWTHHFEEHVGSVRDEVLKMSEVEMQVDDFTDEEKAFVKANWEPYIGPYLPEATTRDALVEYTKIFDL